MLQHGSLLSQTLAPLPDPGLHRYRAIDGFRFIAALGIVLHHYARYSDNALWQGLFFKNYLFVDLFFVISGFVIMLAYGKGLKTLDDAMSFLQNRLARIYPLHLLMFLAFLAIDAAAWSGLYHPHEAHVDEPAEMAANLFLVQAWGATQRLSFNYPSWSISAEWMLYILFPAVAFAMRRGGAVAMFGLAALALLALEALNATGRLGTWTQLTYQLGYLRAVPTFLAGAGLCCAVDRCALLFRSFRWPWAFFLSAVVLMLLHANDLLIIVLFVLTVASATGAERAGAKGFLVGPLMGRLGDWSYALYMIHALVGSLMVATIGPRLLHLQGIAQDIYILACVALCTGLSALVYRFVEVPARRLLRHRGVERVPLAAAQA